jgi:hypothetical protein
MLLVILVLLETSTYSVLGPEQVPIPQYHRSTARILQKSLSIPAFILVLSVWSIGIGIVFLDPGSAEWAKSIYTAWESAFSSMLPRWLMRANIPLLVVKRMFHYPRLSCSLLILFARMTTFVMLEFPRLEFLAQRIRYERYASSFDYIKTEDIDSRVRDRRFAKEWLYQYQPLWRLCVPAFLIASNLIAATWPSARPFLLYLPYSPIIDVRLIQFVGEMTFVETVLRVLGEVCWRYFGWDTPVNGRPYIALSLPEFPSPLSANSLVHTYSSSS